MQKISLFLFCLLFACNSISAQNDSVIQKPVRVGVVGLTHAHVNWLLGGEKKKDIDIVGIAEPDRQVVAKLAKEYGFSMDIVFNTIEEMVTKTKPEAVFAFNDVFSHLKVVEYCAPHGIDVMVEKPLAVSLADVQKMIALAKKHRIHLLTNYETSYYGTNKAAWDIINDKKEIGDVRKIVFKTGHQGPVEIGCPPEFLAWLTDPVLNGGGAITDFGCYGANLSTWLMKNQTPISVTGITQQIKPLVYPKVDDEATIILTYPSAQVVIQASWNWPSNWKTMDVYGKTGYVACIDKDNMLVMNNGQLPKDTLKAAAMPDDFRDPYVYFANVVRGKIKVEDTDLASTTNNEIVMKILEAAKQSAKTGKTIIWNEFFKQ